MVQSKPFRLKYHCFAVCGSKLNPSQSRSALNGYHSSRTILPRNRFWYDVTKTAAREAMAGLSLAVGGLATTTATEVKTAVLKHLKTSNVGKF